MRPDLLEIYHRLYEHFGPQHWWPAESPFEMIVGAILTQNTSWSNVEKALIPLRERGLLIPLSLHTISEAELARLIRPCGFFNIKAKRLKEMVRFIFQEYGGSLERMFSEKRDRLRGKLLAVKGIGPETADSILLYGGNFPIFVVDAYTRRIFSRHGLIGEALTYPQIQAYFMGHLPEEVPLYNEYHALIVKTAKVFCKTLPDCAHCPLGYLMEGRPAHEDESDGVIQI